MPGTASKAVGPTENAAMKDAMEEAGRPAASSTGGIWAPMVVVRRLERMTEYLRINGKHELSM
jgi:hypothetical protein